MVNPLELRTYRPAIDPLGWHAETVCLPVYPYIGQRTASTGSREIIAGTMGNDWPFLKARQLLAILQRPPLRYTVTDQRGSHRKLRSDVYPPLLFAFHDKQTIPPGLVKKILTRDVGLDEDEANGILGL